MSKDVVVMLVDDPGEDEYNIDGQSAEVWMRFYEPCTDDLLNRLAKENPGKRVYQLSGASTWYSARTNDAPRT